MARSGILLESSTFTFKCHDNDDETPGSSSWQTVGKQKNKKVSTLGNHYIICIIFNFTLFWCHLLSNSAFLQLTFLLLSLTPHRHLCGRFSSSSVSCVHIGNDRLWALNSDLRPREHNCYCHVLLSFNLQKPN